MKQYLFFLLMLTLLSFNQDDRTRFFPKTSVLVEKMPNKNNIWVFILAGQSNMAGRGLVEPQDTMPDERIFTINVKGELILAKEPLHFQEPSMQGLDCGLSFGRRMIENIPEKIKILIIPTAIGGSSISQWLGDSLYRNVRLLSNFKEKIEIGKKYGNIKGILWHQGENDANPTGMMKYQEKLSDLFKKFRNIAGNNSLPVIMGELSSFPKNYENHQKMNHIIREYSSKDKYTAVVPTNDFKDKGDNVHFNSEGQRKMGQRFAEVYMNRFSDYRY